MLCEDKVRHRVGHLKAESLQLLADEIAIFDDSFAVSEGLLLVCHGADSRRRGHRIHVIGVCGIFYSIKIGDKRGTSHAEAESCPRHGAGL